MNRTLLFFALLLGLFYNAVGQSNNLILTAEQNEEWLDSLSSLSLDKKLTIIKERLLADTNVFVRQSYADGWLHINIKDSLGNRVYGTGKPTIIIEETPILIDNKTEASKIVALTSLLNDKTIDKIEIFTPSQPATLALYGSSGLSGVIKLKLTKGKYMKKFNELKNVQ